MKYVQISTIKRAAGEKLFDKIHVKASRRDLIKQLLAMGAVTTTTLMRSPLSLAMDDSKDEDLLLNNTTWRRDEKYEGLRQALIWKPNKPERFPDVIVHAQSEKEIKHALAFAQKNDLKVVPRCSGHNIDTMRDGGMLLDISSMIEMTIDMDSLQASVQSAVISSYFYQNIAEQGFIFPVPECHTVALGGYLLGGGYASMGYYWGEGPACYSILAADVILADGRQVTASKEDNADLYWAVRGVGPGFFGVVTRFQLQLYKQPEVLMQSTYHYPLNSLRKVLAAIEGLSDIKSTQTQITMVLQKPPGASNPPAIKLNIRALGKDESETRALLSPYSDIDSLSIKSKSEYQLTSYEKFMYNPSRSERNLSDNIWTDDRSVLAAVVKYCRSTPEDSSFIMTLYSDRQLYPLKDDACHSPAGMHFMSNHLLWNESDKDEVNKRWYAGLCNLLWPYASSYYVNQMEGTQQKERMKACFSTENWQRLSELRQKYDPDKRFYAHVGWD